MNSGIYYIKNNKVYYSKHEEPRPVLKSIEVVDGKIRLNHHDDPSRKISNEVYDTMKKMLIEYYHGIGLRVNKFISELNPETMIRINGNVIETVYNIDNDYIYYDFYFIYPKSISNGYYWSLRLKKEDSRIGKRKLYQSSKGLYFIENGYRNYIDSFYKIK